MKKTKTENDKSIDEIFGDLDKMNPDAAFLDKSALSQVTSYIDTGCYALNAICSGSLRNGGIPSGRITGFAGPSSAGKTLMMNKIIANAQKKENRFAVVWDTEISVDKRTVDSVGGDSSRFKHCPVETIEDCRNQIAQFLVNVVAKGQQGKFIIGIDSIGNLVSAKENADTEKGKEAADMGTRAKALKSLLRSITYKAAKADVPIIFLNHIYDNPTEMFPSLVKTQAGGKGPIYMASLLVQLAHHFEKDEKGDQQSVAASHKIVGSTLNAMTVKNRFVPPFLKTSMYLNFKTGLDRYAGLLELALAYGVIIQTGSTYTLTDGTKLGYSKSFVNDADFWENEIIPVLDPHIEREFSYSNTKYEALIKAAEVEEGDEEADEE
jgi:RecA/RadA recombinase